MIAFNLMFTFPLALLTVLFAGPQFVPQEIDSNVSIGYGLAIGDVDGDRKPDILLADKKQFVWYRNGDWKRFVMAEDLTTFDNVCIAARDIDGDGKVEVAVGAQWNPSETSDTLQSGAVFYLVRPNDPTQQWNAIKLHHEPTTHRMRWVKVSGNTYHLVVLPLHGRGNKNGEGKGVKVIAYEKPDNVSGPWKHFVIDATMHMTHNMEVGPAGDGEMILVGGREGVKKFVFENKRWHEAGDGWPLKAGSFGEVRLLTSGREKLVVGIEPMHGNELTVYQQGSRQVLTSGLNQGHALAAADLLGKGSDQIVAGWREPDSEKRTGIKLFVRENGQWRDHWVDNNGIACEDLQVADLDGDGKKDIIAAGRSTHNLRIYWNKSK
jgi:hypothetical protein